MECEIVKERQYIVGNKIFENQQYKYVKEFDNLEKFIKEYTSDKKNEDAWKFMRILTKPGIGDVINIEKYVGTIQFYNNSQIEILPKIDLIENEDNKTKKILWNMIKCLKEFQSKSLNWANVDVENMNLYEVFISMYIDELNKIIKQGLFFSYTEKNSNLNTVKGKIIINKQIQKNIVHKERFFCNYDEFSIDTPENRIIKMTLFKLIRISNSNNNIKSLKRLLLHFDNVKETTNYDSEFSKITINKQNVNYENILKWSKIFLKEKSFINFSGNNKARALLFDMEKLFEAYITKITSKKMSQIDNKYKVIPNKSLSTVGVKYLFDEPKKRSFRLKPDILIKNENNEVIAILDTKWKILENIPDNNYSISVQDMYQMYAYGKKYGTKNIWLVYPSNKEMKKIKKTIYFEGENDIRVNVFFVEFDNIEENISKLVKSVIKPK